uniref:Immunoglobulin domain-containing protein n=1 Tax=Cyprinus carpio TaxID=7962 RepID=A0A8C2HCZ9_CYPCA
MFLRGIRAALFIHRQSAKSYIILQGNSRALLLWLIFFKQKKKKKKKKKKQMHVFIFLLMLCLRVQGFFSIGSDTVLVKVGDSVTLHTSVKMNGEEMITWYSYEKVIAQITGDLSYICTDVQCNKGNERFRDRLKLDHQTGSLTITNIRTRDSGDYDVWISSNSSEKRFSVLAHGFPSEQDEMKKKIVKEEESVTLDPGVVKKTNDMMTWYFNDTLIAEISDDPNKTCTDVQCNEGTVRFRDRLEVNHQTGSLTIMNTRTTDSGLYELQITSRNNSVSISSIKSFIVIVTGVDVVKVAVSVKEGDSFTLHTDVETDQQEMILWYFNGIQIAEINGDQSKIFTDDWRTERFRDRLELDHQTGSLTINDPRYSDSGIYELLIFGIRVSIKIFSAAVHYVSAAERDEIMRTWVKEGESVTLDPGVVKKTNDVMTWYFDDILIAEINEDLNKTHTDDQSEDGDERFRDRLQLDNQTGSLTIMNTRIIDSGPYKLQIISRNNSVSISSIKSLSVTVIGFFGVDTDGVSLFVKEGDSFTLYTDVETDKQEIILWYFNGFQIAEINGDQSKIFTDDWRTKKFRDRLKLDHQTGSLTINDPRYSDSGIYHLRIFSNRRGSTSRKIFVVGIYGVEEYYIMGLSDGSLTLDPGEVKKPNDLMTWYFNDTLIAEITGDQSKICTDDQCKERFRGRLQMDHQTGSLTITNIRIKDTGYYKLLRSSSDISIIKSFDVRVHGEYHLVMFSKYVLRSCRWLAERNHKSTVYSRVHVQFFVRGK